MLFWRCIYVNTWLMKLHLLAHVNTYILDSVRMFVSIFSLSMFCYAISILPILLYFIPLSYFYVF